jgi:hypothetical protein
MSILNPCSFLEARHPPYSIILGYYRGRHNLNNQFDLYLCNFVDPFASRRVYAPTGSGDFFHPQSENNMIIRQNEMMIKNNPNQAGSSQRERIEALSDAKSTELARTLLNHSLR